MTIERIHLAQFLAMEGEAKRGCLRFSPSVVMETYFPQFDVRQAFEPHRFLRGGHLQTLAGNCLPGVEYPSASTLHHVEFRDGDIVVLHDDCPLGWKDTDRTALLIHGLAGTSQSPYMTRVSGKLTSQGVRVFRMDLRGVGAGSGLARMPYHPGRSYDGLWAIRYVSNLCPRSPLSLVGFSLGANLALKMLGELREKLPPNLHRAIAINPPIDLSQAVESLEHFFTQIYNKRFVKTLRGQVANSARLLRRNALAMHGKHLRKIRDFDDFYTRAVWGFSSVEEYYQAGSAKSWLAKIQVPTLILASEDDPIVPPAVFAETPRSPSVQLHLTKTGGHMGYVGRKGIDGDRRWMEWRIVDWITAEEPKAALAKAA